MSSHEENISEQLSRTEDYLSDCTGQILVGHDRGGAIFSKVASLKVVSKRIKNQEYFNSRAKNMKKDIDSASDLIEESFNRMGTSLDRLPLKESDTADKIKKVSGKVRASTSQLSDGLAKIEKLANFDRMEKYVLLLERAATAIESLSALEKSGKLDKIASSIR
jgi:gas vesicle protein